MNNGKDGHPKLIWHFYSIKSSGTQPPGRKLCLYHDPRLQLELQISYPSSKCGHGEIDEDIKSKE